METPVHYCARAGNSDILLEIVKHIEPSKVQIAVNKQSKNGWSPLLVASNKGHLEIVRILLQTHARVDVFDEVCTTVFFSKVFDQLNASLSLRL